MSKPFSIPMGLILLAMCWAASIYWSPYHSCVRALVESGDDKAGANLYCAKLLKAN